MQLPGIPDNEEDRLKSLYMTRLLDTRDDERFERLTRLARIVFQVGVRLINGKYPTLSLFFMQTAIY